jgi:rhodanese-related sulfurtransferase
MFGLHSTPSISVEEAAALAGDGRLLLVDVREAGEVAQAAVPGARHIPLRQLATRSDELPRDRRIGFVCRSGSRSAGATKAALKAGFDAVNVKGGVMAWSRAGLPLSNERRSA